MTHDYAHAARLVLSAVLLFTPLAAAGEEITVEFAGTVTSAEMDAGLFRPSVQLGDPFSGRFRYDLGAIDQEPSDATLGSYDAIEWVIDGSTVVLANPSIRVQLDATADGLIVAASGGSYLNGIPLGIAAPPGTLGFDWLPAALDLADFSAGTVQGSKGFLSLDPQIPSTLVRDVGTLTMLAPEPDGLATTAWAALVATSWRRRSPPPRRRCATRATP